MSSNIDTRCPFPIVMMFFFQAEAGIRDFHVTGVQTCALPILQICGAFEDPCPLARRGGIPICVYAIGNGESAIDILDRRGANLSDRLVPIRGIAHCVRSSTSFLPCDDRGALPSFVEVALHLCAQWMPFQR